MAAVPENSPRWTTSNLSGAARILCSAVLQSGILFGLVVLCVVAFAQKKPPAKPIDLNTASVEQLEQLPGVGPVTAKSIYDFRRKSGPFHRPEDLLSIRGISAKRYQAIAPYVVVSQLKPTASPKPATPGTAPKPPAKPAATTPK
jgi:competence ComEA-like helix-hairpin-helix protein